MIVAERADLHVQTPPARMEVEQAADIFDLSARMNLESERALNAVRLLTRIRLEDPGLWAEIQTFARDRKR